MTWVRLDDAFPDHPKVLAAGPMAAFLHVAAICYCSRYLTDGRVPKAVVARLAEVPRPAKLAAALVDCGLWHDQGDHYEVNSYLEYNPAKEKVLADRDSKAKAGRKGAASRWHGKSDSSRHDSAIPDSMPPSRPPSLSKSSSSSRDPSGPVDDDVELILGLFVDRKLAGANGQVKNPKPWRVKVLENARAEGLDVEAARLYATYDVSHAQVAEVLVAGSVPASWGSCRRSA